MAIYTALSAVGLVAGFLGGRFGIGGGSIMVPALILLMNFKQFDAFGASLAAMVPPSGLLGAIEYYRNGYVNIRFALLLSVGLLIGAHFGARLVIGISPLLARRFYGAFLLVVALRFLIVPKLGRWRADDYLSIRAADMPLPLVPALRALVAKIEQAFASCWTSPPSSTGISCSTQLQSGMFRK